MESAKKEKNKRKRFVAYILLTLVVLALVAFGWQWYKDYTSVIVTDDAYVDADKVAVSPKIQGRILQLFASEGDSVIKGQLLVMLDSSDLVAQKQHLLAGVEQSQTTLDQAIARYNLDLVNIKVQQVALDRAKDDFERARMEFESNVITQQQFDHAQKSYESAQAQLESANSQVKVSKANVESARSAIKTAQSQVNITETQLSNTRIYAPESGIIAKRWLLQGDIAQAGQSVFTITIDSVLYVTSYMEETKIAYLHKGQEVNFTVDAFPDVTFKGKIFYMATNTASQFSLIPPNNASGNFTKVTQRIPIKISIDDWNNKNLYPNLRLVAGMSVYLKINKD